MREKWRIMCVLFSSPIPDPQSHSTARYPLPRFEFLGRQSHYLLRLLLLSQVPFLGPQEPAAKVAAKHLSCRHRAGGHRPQDATAKGYIRANDS